MQPRTLQAALGVSALPAPCHSGWLLLAPDRLGNSPSKSLGDCDGVYIATNSKDCHCPQDGQQAQVGLVMQDTLLLHLTLRTAYGISVGWKTAVVFFARAENKVWRSEAHHVTASCRYSLNCPPRTMYEVGSLVPLRLRERTAC